MKDPRNLEFGQKIGYLPVNTEHVRWTGIVKHHYGGDRNVGVVVEMTDDPGIEEKVPYENIEAIEPKGKA